MSDQADRSNKKRKFNRFESKEHLIADYLRLKEKLGRKPKFREFAKIHHSIYNLNSIFGRPGWRRLALACGDNLKRYDRSAKITKHHLLQDYLALKKKLGRQPTLTEYQREHHSKNLLSKHFPGQGWTKLVKAAGDEIVRKARTSKITSDHLKNDFLELQHELGRRPKLSEFSARHHTNKVLVRVFGGRGWGAMIAVIGNQALPKTPLTKEHLTQDYFDLKRELGRQPKLDEFLKKHHAIKVLNRIFGRSAWSALVKASEQTERKMATS